MTNTEREKLKWAYIVEQNELLRLENVGLKLWIGTLLNSDGFDNGRYDAHDLRIARNQIKKMLDGQLIQEEIGVEFSRVLFDNLWDLYIDV